jgi:hypothetical protein
MSVELSLMKAFHNHNFDIKMIILDYPKQTKEVKQVIFKVEETCGLGARYWPQTPVEWTIIRARFIWKNTNKM